MMKNTFSPLFWISLVILVSSTSYADVYRCRDSSGHLITSDRAMPECADKATKVYTNRGALKEELSGAMTPEERRTVQFREQQRANELRELERKQKEQRYLLTHYPTEQDIEVARQKELESIETKIATEKRVIEVTTEALKKNQGAQTRIPKSDSQKMMEAQIQEDSLNQTIKQSTRMLERYNVQKGNINRQFDATHKRYLEVVGSSAKQ